MRYFDAVAHPHLAWFDVRGEERKVGDGIGMAFCATLMGFFVTGLGWAGLGTGDGGVALISEIMGWDGMGGSEGDSM